MFLLDKHDNHLNQKSAITFGATNYGAYLKTLYAVFVYAITYGIGILLCAVFSTTTKSLPALKWVSMDSSSTVNACGFSAFSG